MTMNCQKTGVEPSTETSCVIKYT